REMFFAVSPDALPPRSFIIKKMRFLIPGQANLLMLVQDIMHRCRARFGHADDKKIGNRTGGRRNGHNQLYGSVNTQRPRGDSRSMGRSISQGVTQWRWP